MELEKRFIVREDFSSVRRGYDQEEVDAHLRQVAEAVEELKRASGRESGGSRQTASAGSIAGAAAEQVRTIVEAAERSAAEIEAGATEEADRLTGEATHQAEQERNTARGEAERVRREADEAAQEARERAEADAAEHVAKVQGATAGMRERADTVESDLTGLVDQLRGTIDSLLESVRSSAGSLEAELQSIHAGLAEVRESQDGEDGEDTYAAATPEFEAEAGQTTKLTPTVAADEPTAEQSVAGDHEDPDAVDPDAQPVEEELDYGESEEDVEGAPVAAEDELEADDEVQTEPAESSAEGDGAEGARLIALNMALNGTPREETARYLEENFDLEDQEKILDDVYARVGG